MFKHATPLFLICETPLHAGSGSDLGIVDLPVQRERHTGFPKVEGSSLKGCIREAFEKPNLKKDIQVGAKKVLSDPAADKNYEQAVELAFGPENAGNDNYAGALGFTDARVLLFPVKSMKGVFAWITCPKVIERFVNDLELCGISCDFTVPAEKTAPSGCNLFIKDNKIVLEEYTFEITKDSADKPCTKFAGWLSDNIFQQKIQQDTHAYWQNKIRNDVVVLDDDDFRDFVNLSTEVITRTKINNETGTVQPGALFTEEYLPAETILCSLVLASPVFREKENKGIFNQIGDSNGMFEAMLVTQFFKEGLPEMLQLGGNATIGKGLVRTKFPGVKNG
ncbi:MAG: type III-B CRISPR module RAMP protein Cmr4 [Desulfobacteraceae bacterium]|nr:type III-B CRISPR module RAMP protein Cmr4 [Desulfobacteraceae bacterium]